MPLKPFRPALEPLVFPSEDGTKTYTAKPVGLKSAATFLLSLDEKSDVTLSPLEQQEILLGPLRQEMVDDDVSAEYLWRVYQTVRADVQRGRAVAEVIWESDPKALETLRAQLESEASTSTGEANATPSPASTSTTKTSRPRQKQSPTGSRSRGTKSSRPAGSSSSATS